MRILFAAALLAGGIWGGSYAVTWADSVINPNQPGSANDPLVSKSYVDEKLGQLVKEEIGKLGGTAGGGGSAELEVVTLAPGQTLYAGAGTEMIVRVGKTQVVSSTVDGIPDVTSGVDVKPGSSVELNHLLINPREGRGLKHNDREQVSVIMMVRGGYLKVDANGNTVE
ncbi:hypothetical protein DUZ99_13205 [Xylanibacillus composti]|nr:hypothetical protein [Xylanibacillus composti]